MTLRPVITALDRRKKAVRHLLDAWRANPSLLYQTIRESQTAQAVFCVPLGVLVGLITVLLHETIMLAHEWIFLLTPGEHLSVAMHIDVLRTVGVPMIGGLILGIVTWLMKRWRSGEIVDPIEANAMFGGRMSVIDSGRLLVAALISNIAGVSVGMEAAYTQIGSAVTSRIGRYFQLRREDLRVIVAAGAAAAIAAAFNAPLAGAFYGFELVLSTYTIAALPQVAVCALSGALFMRIVTQAEPLFSLPLDITDVPAWDYPLFVAMGIFSALIGIATMKSVTYCEHAARRTPVPEWLRPACGGVVVGILAIGFPQVLGSGQGAINDHLHESWPLLILGMLLVAKIAASALSISAGFRGGLFSSALLLGCLFGQISGAIAGFILPQTGGQLEVFMLVGMGAVAASIVGAPVTMVLLVLEMTGNFPATTAVFIGVLVSSIITRATFGYSFSTWRFHLRGLRILNAHDVGWVRELTIGGLLQTGIKTASADEPLAALRTEMPPGSVIRVFVIDSNGQYMGVIDTADLHNHDLDNKLDQMKAGDLAKGGGHILLPSQNIKDALDLFTSSKQEVLPVVVSAADKRLLGHVTESYILKRYTHELEARNLAQSGAGTPVTPASA